jgi:cytidylate kinase
MSTPLVIAIDGPAGSGKSTVASALAGRLSLATLDTGATYRAVAAAVVERGIDPEDASAVAKVAKGATLEIEGRVIIDDLDVTDHLRRPTINQAVSVVAANPAVRDAMVAFQRSWVAAHQGGVVEGRDIGTVVFPDAPIKLYLTASPEERARRRSEEGLASIERRDLLDSTRASSPLAQADDALAIDTTTTSVEVIVNLVMAHIEELGGNCDER